MTGQYQFTYNFLVLAETIVDFKLTKNLIFNRFYFSHSSDKMITNLHMTCVNQNFTKFLILSKKSQITRRNVRESQTLFLIFTLMKNWKKKINRKRFQVNSFPIALKWFIDSTLSSHHNKSPLQKLRKHWICISFILRKVTPCYGNIFLSLSILRFLHFAASSWWWLSQSLSARQI